MGYVILTVYSIAFPVDYKYRFYFHQVKTIS